MVFVGEVDKHMHCFILKPLPGVKTRQILPKHIGIEDIRLASRDVLVIELINDKIVHLNLNGIIVDQTDDDVKQLMKDRLFPWSESQMHQSLKYIEFLDYKNDDKYVLCYDSSGIAKKVAEYNQKRSQRRSSLNLEMASDILTSRVNLWQRKRCRQRL